MTAVPHVVLCCRDGIGRLSGTLLGMRDTKSAAIVFIHNVFSVVNYPLLCYKLCFKSLEQQNDSTDPQKDESLFKLHTIASLYCLE